MSIDKERAKFLSQLEQQEEKIRSEKYKFNDYSGKRMRSMTFQWVMAAFFAVLLFAGLSIYFNNKVASENSGTNTKMMHNAVAIAVYSYKDELGHYPTLPDGESLDYEALKNKGYLTIDVEGYRDMFYLKKDRVLKKLSKH